MLGELRLALEADAGLVLGQLGEGEHLAGDLEHRCLRAEGVFGAVFFFAQMLQTSLGYGPLDAGLRLMPWTVTFITVAPVVGNLVDRIGPPGTGPQFPHPP